MAKSNLSLVQQLTNELSKKSEITILVKTNSFQFYREKQRHTCQEKTHPNTLIFNIFLFTIK